VGQHHRGSAWLGLRSDRAPGTAGPVPGTASGYGGDEAGGGRDRTEIDRLGRLERTSHRRERRGARREVYDEDQIGGAMGWPRVPVTEREKRAEDLAVPREGPGGVATWIVDGEDVKAWADETALQKGTH
jgi:hypothetical protein